MAIDFAQQEILDLYDNEEQGEHKTSTAQEQQQSAIMDELTQ